MQTLNTTKQNNRTCLICKQPFYYDTWYKDHGRMHTPDNNCCDTCQHWAEQLVSGGERYIINGEQYRVGARLESYQIKASDTLQSIADSFSSPGSNHFKGMGGSKHIIRTFNGKIVITDDLWHQGTIPQHFLAYPGFKNNAEFVGA